MSVLIGKTLLGYFTNGHFDEEGVEFYVLGFEFWVLPVNLN